MKILVPTGVQTVVCPDVASLCTDYIILAASDYQVPKGNSQLTMRVDISFTQFIHKQEKMSC